MPKRSNAVAIPDQDEIRLARAMIEFLHRHPGQELTISFGDNAEKLALPATAIRHLFEILEAVTEGSAVSVTPHTAELTTQQAADLLGVSRPFLIKQLEAGAVPFRKVGSHRRVRMSDLLAYKRATDRRRDEVLDELVDQAQDLDLGY